MGGRRRGRVARHGGPRIDRVRIARLAERLGDPPELPVSGRVGVVDGHPTRTFFLRLEPVRDGVAMTRFMHRLDEGHTDDLESQGGLPAEVFMAAVERRTAEVRRRAAAYSITFELPYETDSDTRAAIVSVVGERFAAWGATWAVHVWNRVGEPNTRGQVLVLAGPAGERPVEGSGAVRTLRRFVASTVNTVSWLRSGRRLPREWHGGTLADTGIDRPPRPNIPFGLYRARRRQDELVREGRAVPARVAKFAAAADRIDAAFDMALQEGRVPEPQGQHRRRWRIAERERLQAALRGLAGRIAALERASAQVAADDQRHRGEQA